MPGMSNYRNAMIARPIAVMLVPGAILFGNFLNSFLAVSAWLLLNGALGWYIRCRQCGSSIYFNRDRPYRTLLAIPHKACTICGRGQD
jgi:hypothetical protein